MPKYPNSASHLRNFVFGVEDSLVSTVGLLSGLAIAQSSREAIFLTGVILIFVEAFSMAAGSFLSEYTEGEYLNKTETVSKSNITDGAIMFGSYFISGFIPLLPYLIFQLDNAFWFSIFFSILALFALGILAGKVSKTSFFKNAVRMVLIGGMAIAVGILAGVITRGLV